MLEYVQRDFQGEQAWEKENVVWVGGVNIFVLLFFFSTQTIFIPSSFKAWITITENTFA